MRQSDQLYSVVYVKQCSVKHDISVGFCRRSGSVWFGYTARSAACIASLDSKNQALKILYSVRIYSYFSFIFCWYLVRLGLEK